VTTGSSTAPGAGGSPTSINRDYKSPHMYDYNLAIEQQLPFETILNVAYAGSRGLNLFQPAKEVNPFCPTTNAVVPQGCAGFTVPVTGSLPVWGSTSAPRLNPYYSNFALFDTGGQSLYNALQVNLTKRTSHGLQMQVAYTYSKLMDNTEGVANADTSGATPGQFENPFDANVDYGPSNFDVTHNLHANVVYHLPKVTDRQLLGKVANGWWTGSIVSFQTGQPFSPSISTDREQSGIAGTNGGLERPSLVTAANIGAVTAAAVAAGITTCPANSSGCLPYIPVIYDPKTVINHRVDQWFNPNMFTLQAFGTIGDVRRNILREPGLVNWDFSLNKSTAVRALGEGGSVEFRTEVFNVLNHTNFGPSRNGGFFSGSAAPQAGQTVAVERPNPTGLFSTSTPAREFQFSLKVLF
jgi:hypothetical protein